MNTIIKDENEKRHAMLIDFLSQFHQYTYTKTRKPKLVKVAKSLSSGQVQYIDSNHINAAVTVFCDALNIESASCGTFQLYDLLNTYLTDLDCRKQLNEVVDQARTKKYPI